MCNNDDDDDDDDDDEEEEEEEEDYDRKVNVCRLIGMPISATTIHGYFRNLQLCK